MDDFGNMMIERDADIVAVVRCKECKHWGGMPPKH